MKNSKSIIITICSIFLMGISISAYSIFEKSSIASIDAGISKIDQIALADYGIKEIQDHNC